MSSPTRKQECWAAGPSRPSLGLWGNGVLLPSDWACPHPEDWGAQWCAALGVGLRLSCRPSTPVPAVWSHPRPGQHPDADQENFPPSFPRSPVCFLSVHPKGKVTARIPLPARSQPQPLRLCSAPPRWHQQAHRGPSPGLSPLPRAPLGPQSRPWLARTHLTFSARKRHSQSLQRQALGPTWGCRGAGRGLPQAGRVPLRSLWKLSVQQSANYLLGSGLKTVHTHESHRDLNKRRWQVIFQSSPTLAHRLVAGVDRKRIKTGLRTEQQPGPPGVLRGRWGALHGQRWGREGTGRLPGPVPWRGPTRLGGAASLRPSHKERHTWSAAPAGAFLPRASLADCRKPRL